jgi:uncharacterized protein (TIGR02453 family)
MRKERRLGKLPAVAGPNFRPIDDGLGAPTMTTRHFDPALFAFLRDLTANNDREWFAEQRPRYESAVRGPALAFIVDFGAPLVGISPHFRADPRPQGGSLFRIHRDIRFATDKSPYKTHIGLHFRHEQGQDAHTPGFYLHLEPGGSFVGLGLWHPDNPTLARLRAAVVADPAAWRRAVGARRFTAAFKVEGDELVRVPRGFDPDHPLSDVLRLKDYTAIAPLTARQVTGAGFLETFAGLCRDGAPFMAWQCRALGLPF